MWYKKAIAVLPLTFFAFLIAAQPNLVSNQYFKTDSKPKKAGQIGLAEGWSSPTDTKADLFHEKGKEGYGAPDNMYGRETNEEAESYAGLRLWSYKNARPNSFLVTELSAPMMEDEVYCVKFSVSLADLSKYACNNIGAYLSNQELTGKQIVKYQIEPQVKQSKNAIIEEQYTWKPICRTFKAEGGEKFLYMGNFKNPDDTEIKKIKRPRGFNKPQITDAYYYVNDVSVITMDSLEECLCEKKGPRMNVVYSHSLTDSAQMKDHHKIEYLQIHFALQKTDIIENSYDEIHEIVALLDSNPDWRLEIIGHTDLQEQLKAPDDFSKQRAQVVADYMVSKGVSRERLVVKGMKDAELVTQEESQAARARNRRVSFKVLR